MYIVVSLVVLLVALAIHLGIVVWVYKDASRRGPNALLWTIVVLFTAIPGWIIYLVARPLLPTAVDLQKTPPNQIQPVQYQQQMASSAPTRSAFPLVGCLVAVIAVLLLVIVAAITVPLVHKMILQNREEVALDARIRQQQYEQKLADDKLEVERQQAKRDKEEAAVRAEADQQRSREEAAQEEQRRQEVVQRQQEAMQHEAQTRQQEQAKREREERINEGLVTKLRTWATNWSDEGEVGKYERQTYRGTGMVLKESRITLPGIPHEYIIEGVDNANGKAGSRNVSIKRTDVGLLGYEWIEPAWNMEAGVEPGVSISRIMLGEHIWCFVFKEKQKCSTQEGNKVVEGMAGPMTIYVYKQDPTFWKELTAE